MALTDKLTAIADAIRSMSGKTDGLTMDQMPAEILDINPLNFKVVSGTTQPSNAVENMIWVNTDTTISGYVFSATQPTSPAEGMAWITVGTSSPIAFNALKKNSIMLHPISAKQYVGGAWVDKEAKSYQGGAWVELVARTYLYDLGDQCTEVTGGWFTEKGTNGSASLENDSINFSYTSVSMAWMAAGTKNSIDLSKYSTLIFDMSVSEHYTSYGGVTVVGVTSNKAVATQVTYQGNVGGNNTFLTSSQPSADGQRREVVVDISNIESGYISIHGIMKANVYRVWAQ